jgi:hypothetical protein
VSVERDGSVFIAVAALVAASTFALALNRRSWPLWLLGFGLTILALWVAYFFRDAERAGARGVGVVIAPRIATYSKEGIPVDQAQRLERILSGIRDDAPMRSDSPGRASASRRRRIATVTPARAAIP